MGVVLTLGAVPRRSCGAASTSRGWRRDAGLKFPAYLAAGFGLWVGVQAFINIGVNMGVLPTKGLTLPLMSYGRSSLIVALAWVGLLLRVYHEADARAARLGHRAGRRVSGPGPHHGRRHRRTRVPGARAGAPAARTVDRGHLARYRARARVAHHPGRGHPHREALDRAACAARARSTWLAAPLSPAPRAAAGAGGHAPSPAERGGGARGLRHRTRRGGRVADAPSAHHPRAERRRRLHQPLPGAPGAPGARGLSRQLRPRRARPGDRQPRAARHQRRARRRRSALPAAPARSASWSSAAARGRRA